MNEEMLAEILHYLEMAKGGLLDDVTLNADYVKRECESIDRLIAAVEAIEPEANAKDA